MENESIIYRIGEMILIFQSSIELDKSVVYSSKHVGKFCVNFRFDSTWESHKRYCKLAFHSRPIQFYMKLWHEQLTQVNCQIKFQFDFGKKSMRKIFIGTSVFYTASNSCKTVVYCSKRMPKMLWKFSVWLKIRATFKNIKMRLPATIPFKFNIDL